MKAYQTKYYGAPYGINGEAGADTTAPQRLARETLQPGQTMDVYSQGRIVKRYRCTDGRVSEVEIG